LVSKINYYNNNNNNNNIVNNNLIMGTTTTSTTATGTTMITTLTPIINVYSFQSGEYNIEEDNDDNNKKNNYHQQNIVNRNSEIELQTAIDTTIAKRTRNGIKNFLNCMNVVSNKPMISTLTRQNKNNNINLNKNKKK